jgi:hypothetical protein
MKTKPAKNHPWIAIPFSSTIRRNRSDRDQAIRAARERAKQFSQPTTKNKTWDQQQS